MTNRNGETVITSDSSPTAAIRSAFERWSAIEDSAIRFAEPRADRRAVTTSTIAI